MITIRGPKGELDKVRILGPYRKFSQVEIMIGDNFKLGTKAPIRESGDLEGSEGITLIGPAGEVVLQQGLIVAKRHIHMSVADAQNFGVTNGQIVKVKTNGERGLIFDEVVIRVSDAYALDMHIDLEEGNAAGLQQGDRGTLLID